MSGSRQLRGCRRRNPSTFRASSEATVMGVLRVPGRRLPVCKSGAFSTYGMNFCQKTKPGPHWIRIAVVFPFFLSKFRLEDCKSRANRIIVLQIARHYADLVEFWKPTMLDACRRDYARSA